MQSLQNDKIKTEFQNFILQLSKLQTQIQKATLTFIALVPNNYDQSLFGSVQQFNQYFLETFSNAIYGKQQQQFRLDSYKQITVQNVTIFIKQFMQQNKLIRLVYIPANKYDLSNDQVGSISYIQMVKKFFLSNLFMKPLATQNIKLIGMKFIPKPASGLKGKLQGINLSEHVKKLFEGLKQNYNLEYQPQLSKLTFLFTVQEIRQPLVFTNTEDKIQEQNIQILVLTNDKKKHPVYKLERQQQDLKLSSNEIILAQSKNLVQVENYHHLFHYNSFINYKPSIAALNILDQLTVKQLWGVVQSIIYPLFRVKQLIADIYKLPQQQGKTKNIFNQIQQQRWSNPKLIKNDFYKFNELFQQNEWINQKQNTLVIKDDDEEQFAQNRDYQQQYQQNDIKKQQKNQSTPNPNQEDQQLLKYTEYFSVYSRFINQQPNFIHSMILDQINSLSKNISEIADEIHKSTKIQHLKQSEKKVRLMTKVIVRFLAQLKKYTTFSSILQEFNPDFNQYLLDIYLSAYDEFCSANNQIYGKMFDLSKKVQELKSTKKQILKVVKSVNSFTQIYKAHTYATTIDDLENKRLLLEILLRLLKENKSQQKDKEIDTKIMSTQYDLGATFYKIGLIQDYGQTQSNNLKVALKILFEELYLKLFIERKDFEKEFVLMVSFNELELLEKISGLLKLIDHIDLAIEVEKKLDNITTVDNYFNRWMMKYHRLNSESDQKTIASICEKAIEYFTTKFQVNKVIHYYDLLIKNSLTFQQKATWKTKKFRYMNYTRDSDWCKKGMEKAEKTLYPITPQTAKAILTALKY